MKEFRIALVCYGGVSLAVYMHGIVKEIHKLVRASAAYDEFRDGRIRANPFDPETDTEYAYFDVLDRLEKYQPVRVTVDVISGASAGGINGVFLGKALAQNRDQAHLRDMWLKNASIRELASEPHHEVPRFLKWITPVLSRLTGLRKLIPEFRGSYAPLMAFTYRSALRREVAPPFDGDKMLHWMYDGVADMKRPPGDALQSLDTLTPSNQSLELYVTTTDFYGYPRYVPVHDPAGRSVHDQKYRHVLRFGHNPRRPVESDFGNNAELAFAARATSSLPGGFSPVQIGDLNRVLGEKLPGSDGVPYSERQFVDRFFRDYLLAGSDPCKTCFADGGILDNRPFSHAIRAILKRSATRQVVRRILYIDPHPISEPPPEDARLPGTFETLLASMSRIPKHEPIHDEIWNLNAFNRRVRRINDTIETTRPVVESLVRQVGEKENLALDADSHVLEEWRRAVNAHAEELETAGYASYVGFKLRSLIDELRDALCEELDYPEDSGHAFFIGNVLLRWMERRRLLPVTETVTDDQIRFLKLFDIGFRRRRLRFLIRGVNTLYPRAGTFAGQPKAGDLDALKRDFYDLMDSYRSSLVGADHRDVLAPLLQAVFGEDILTDRIQRGRVDADSFLDEYGDRLDAYFAKLRDLAWEDNKALHFRLSSVIAECADWDAEPRNELLTRFVGFPFWDVMIFPLIDMGDVGELYEIRGVRMSPDDSVLLSSGGSEKKLRGVRYQHFGAFFSRYARENDYLWGRLDAAERLIDILVDAALENTEHKIDKNEFMAEKTMALGAVLNAEDGDLEMLGPKISALRRVLSRCKVPERATPAESRNQ